MITECTRIARAVEAERRDGGKGRKWGSSPIAAALVYENLVFILDDAKAAFERNNLVAFGEGLKKVCRLAEEALPLAERLVPEDCKEDCKKDIAQVRRQKERRRRLLNGE